MIPKIIPPINPTTEIARVILDNLLNFNSTNAIIASIYYCENSDARNTQHDPAKLRTELILSSGFIILSLLASPQKIPC